MDSEETFRRPAQTRLVGLVRYLILAPLTILIFGLPSVVVIGLVLVEIVGVPPTVVILAGIGIGIPLLFWMVYLVIADLRYLAGAAVTIGRDRVQVEEAGKEFVVSFDDVIGIRLFPFRRDAQCVLQLADGSERRLPPDPAPLSMLRVPLENALLPRLVETFQEAMIEHRTICIEDERWRGALRLIRGLIAAPFFVFLGLRFGGGLIDGTIWKLRCAWRSMTGGCCVSREGVRIGTDPAVHEWADLAEARSDPAGMLLRFGDKTIAISLFAQNYWPFAAWLGANFTFDEEGRPI